ncbi:hypothetical protein AOQ84DRAFT_440934, partial [Glonium stellatum]
RGNERIARIQLVASEARKPHTRSLRPRPHCSCALTTRDSRLTTRDSQLHSYRFETCLLLSPAGQLFLLPLSHVEKKNSRAP